MIDTIIPADAVFDRAALRKRLDLTPTTISREIKLGRLRRYRRAGRDYFLGADVLDWLRSATVDVEQEDDE